MPSKTVKSLISTSIVRYDNQMPGAMIKKKGQEACRHDLMERGKKLIEEIVTDAQAKKEYNNNFDDRKERMTEAVQKKGEWLSEEDMAELLAGFDFVDESSSESSSESDNDEQPAKRQRVAEEQPETAVPEAASVDPENDPVDSETVVAEPAPERRDFQVDDGTIEAINKIMDFNRNKLQLDYVLKNRPTGDFPEIWHVLSTACEHIYLALNSDSPDDQQVNQLKSFVKREVDVLLGWEKHDAIDVQEQPVHDTFTVDFEELDKIAANISDEVCVED